MKRSFKIVTVVIAVVTILGIIGGFRVIAKGNDSTDSMISVIYEYCDSINAKDFERYASVYTKEYAEEILECVQKDPERATFHSSEMSIKQITEIDIETAQAACAYNLDGIRNNCRISGVFYVQIHEKYDGRDMVENRAFIIVEDAGEYKIKDLPYVEVNVLSQFIRVENLEYVNEIISNNRIILQKQYSSNTKSSLVCPTTAKIKLNKTENKTHYGSNVVTLDFHEYLKNVVTQEWIVSYYSNAPSYLQTGTIASKMYAWYVMVTYPNRYPEPYNAALDDTSESQNYLYSGYDNLQNDTYRRYVDNSMNFSHGLALVRSVSEDLFLVQYRSNSGTAHSGVLNQAQAYNLALQGYSAQQILNEYLGSTPYTQGQMVKIITCSEYF